MDETDNESLDSMDLFDLCDEARWLIDDYECTCPDMSNQELVDKHRAYLYRLLIGA